MAENMKEQVMRDRVQKVIDNLRPAFGGTEVVLLGVKDGVVKVQIYATGHDRPPKEATLAILEEELQDAIPEIKEVVAD